MTDPLLAWLRRTLPDEISHLVEPYITKLENGRYEALLQDEESKLLLGHEQSAQLENVRIEDFSTWDDFIFHRLGIALADRSKPEKQIIYFCIGYAALLAFLQSNVTGPPLPFASAEVLFSSTVAKDKKKTKVTRSTLLGSLSIDGISAYKLTPNIELLCLADAIMTCPPILKNVKSARWIKMRVAFMQQRLLSEVSSTLQEVIYDDLGMLADAFTEMDEATKGDMEVEFLLERATIHIHHGLDKFAREDLDRAKDKRRFEFALTGILGKRTKFQENEVSQLVVLARSADEGSPLNGANGANEKSDGRQLQEDDASHELKDTQPVHVDLNDDTLLEAISFNKESVDSLAVKASESLSPSLTSLDPSNQPQLNAYDSTILLLLASSITNTSPQHGLTREETLPYATRVLEGGSSNWQVYTQALLVRSRIEGYKSRTIERGLLQLQALVDQVIADTASTEPSDSTKEDTTATSFLPRPKESESASVTDRLRYIFLLASPTRWDLEAELASRWVQLGGLRSALEIYERLEMWAEAALCWAATEREDKAKELVRRQLYHSTNGGPDVTEDNVDEDEKWQGPERDPPPLDAPRLLCILGDIDQSPAMYERAWEVSKQRYARAQRSLGRLYMASKDFVKAAEAYAKSLRVNQLNHVSWFALGCALLELAQYEKAVEAFSRCVQLDDTDAEAWSNLAAALLRTGPGEDDQAPRVAKIDGTDPDVDEDASVRASKYDPQKTRHDALQALKRAASLKRQSYRIWENVLIVAASLSPPDFGACVAAQKRLIEIRGPTDGERCIDTEILELLVQDIISSTDTYDPSLPGIQRQFVKLIDEDVVPLITGSSRLWQLVGRLALWRNKPSSALDAEEKAWRAVTSQPGWETDSVKRWDAVVEATVRLCDSYESLGPRERTEGMGAGELVAKDWKFKARSAVRGILGKGKGSWEGTEGWDRLQEIMQGLKG